ncbi:MAG TPA: DUF4198 domain-containing protein [Vicinamibacteria bacterium]|nr:DUF4198 domain-containing protein [Vicinamibacteria bacterium]
MHSLYRGAVAVLLSTGFASAHDTWLSGPATAVPGSTVPFQLTSSGTFPSPDHAIDPARIARSLCRVGGKEAVFRAGSRMRQALRLRGRELGAGVAACGVSLGPRTLDLKPDEVEHYLEEIGASGAIGPRWKALPEPRAWRETYVKHATTFVRLGAKDDTTWGEPLGLGLEIVPLADPTRVSAGATLGVRLLKAGRPLAGLALRATHAGKAPAFATTDADGRASFVLAAAGPWLLAATEVRPSATHPSQWESDFATLYLEVAP